MTPSKALQTKISEIKGWLNTYSNLSPTDWSEAKTLSITKSFCRDLSRREFEIVWDSIKSEWLEKGNKSVHMVISKVNNASRVHFTTQNYEEAVEKAEAMVDDWSKLDKPEAGLVYIAPNFFTGDITKNPQVKYYKRYYPKSPVETGDLVRVRFAPSPTGPLHIGGLRTALYNYLFAMGEMKRQGKHGQFILRIEDTDQGRLVPGAVDDIIRALQWFGLPYNEGPKVGGPAKSYVQSERLAIYKRFAQKLLDLNLAYKCFATPEELQEMREEQEKNKQPVGYDRRYRDLSTREIERREALGQKYVIRFRMPRTGTTTVTDMIRGPMVFENKNLEDLVLLKSDGFPTYHLANVVDDHFMGITHIFRGEEWISSAPLHVNLYNAFNWHVPEICHLPLIMAPGGGKLSKRHGATSVEEFIAQGYLPEALMNYLALLGWSFDGSEEIFSKEELLEKFTVERVHPAPATFDYKKLEWFNQHYINHVLSVRELTNRLMPHLFNAGFVSSHVTQYEQEAVEEVVKLHKDRIKNLTDAPELMEPFLVHTPLMYDPKLLIPKKCDAVKTIDVLNRVVDLCDNIGYVDFRNAEFLEQKLREFVETTGLKTGQVFTMIRVAITGRTEAPGLFESMAVLGKHTTTGRLISAMTNLSMELSEKEFAEAEFSIV